MGHIIALEEIILDIMPKGKSIGNTTSTSGFKIIEEEDEIIMMNEELQVELEKERKQN